MSDESAQPRTEECRRQDEQRHADARLGTAFGPVGADLYALGCVGYWLLTGHRVFEEGTPMQIAVQHIHAPPVPPSRRTELPIPEALERAILACLEKTPEGRPADAENLARRLSGCELETCWNEQRARDWWDVHAPQHGQPEPDPATLTRVK